MTYARPALLLAVAAGAIAMIAPAEAASKKHVQQQYEATQSGAPGFQNAQAEVKDSPCRLEIFDTGVSWKSYQTMCGPR